MQAAAHHPDDLAWFSARIPIEFARHWSITPLPRPSPDACARVLIADRPGWPLALHNLRARLGLHIHACVLDSQAAADAFDAVAEQLADAASSEVNTAAASDGDDESPDEDLFDPARLASALERSERDLLATSGRAPVVRLVNAILFDALRREASDVHIQPQHESVAIRYRIDGVLHEARRLPIEALAPLTSRVKVMGRMDIAERRLPQDGRATVTIGTREIDLRLSSLPTAQGERVVIRLLDKRRDDLFELPRLGMDPAIESRFKRLCGMSHGMALVTGPTGSGKTTTLYSVLRLVCTGELNVMTLEDPIEYELSGISQSQINTKKGVTFATGLRHILRQDPDVIMVGEIRDGETARIAVQSALTGHLVLSTLHTNSAAGAITRLRDLGVEGYLINASLLGVLAQRLVRRLCGACAGAGRSSDGQRCIHCLGSGFKGRVGLFELLTMDGALRELVAGDASLAALHQAARSAGMRTLRESGLALVDAGITTLEEVDRVTLIEDAEVFGAASLTTGVAAPATSEPVPRDPGTEIR
ncbi:MAG: GspE/PulE family protein [Phycisphaerales bacterium]